MRFETTVNDIIPRAYDVKSFRVHRPPDFIYKAGQFMMITIRSKGKTHTKPFSISSSPTEKKFVEFTKKLTAHEFSNTLNALRVGEWMEVKGPYGSFTFQGEYERVAMLSGGIGITPLRSMCKYCTDMNSESNIILLYGNRTEKNIIFRDDFEQMQRQNTNLRIVFTLDEPREDWTGAIGMIDADMIKREVPDWAQRVFYTCGPPGMIQVMTNLLRNLNLPAKQIRTENFAGY